MNGEIKETLRSRSRLLVAAASRCYPVQGLCRIVSIRREANDRYVSLLRAECDEKRRYMYCSQAHGYPWMDKSLQFSGSRRRTNRQWAYREDKARQPIRLLFVCHHPLSIALRLGQTRRWPGIISNKRLHGQRHTNGERTHRRTASKMETFKGREIKKGNPATERISNALFRHGTKSTREVLKNGEFVPPRYEIPHFGHYPRSATGHLSRLTICTAF